MHESSGTVLGQQRVMSLRQHHGIKLFVLAFVLSTMSELFFQVKVWRLADKEQSKKWAPMTSIKTPEPATAVAFASSDADGYILLHQY